MASGKRNYFRHSFHARNDDFIMSLISKFKEKGYFMWFALIEVSAEMISDGHEQPLKFTKSRLFKELRCNEKTLESFLKFCVSKSKIDLTYIEPTLNVPSTYLQPTFNLDIVNLPKFMGQYAPNKRKEKEIKENKIIIKQSPLSFLFDKSPEIQKWLNDGIHETHSMLLVKFSHHELADLVEKAFVWAKPKNIRAESWLYTFVSNKNTNAYNPKQAQKSKTRATPDNPTGDPYLAELNEIRKNGESA